MLDPVTPTLLPLATYFRSRYRCYWPFVSLGFYSRRSVVDNYGSTLRDCAAAIKLNAKTSKAYYRSARALIALERLDEALDCCHRCLTFDAAETSIKHLVQDIEQRMGKRRELLVEKERRAKEAKSEKDLLELACAVSFRLFFCFFFFAVFDSRCYSDLTELLLDQARQLTFAVTPASDSPGYPEFDPAESKPYTPTTQIMFPVFLLYPQHSTSDFISRFAEHTTFKDQLAVIFPKGGLPPAWDQENHEYQSGRLAVYAVTRQGRLLKIPSKSTLADVFLQVGTMIKEGDKQVQDGMEIRDGCLSFAIVPKGDVENWYVEDFKKKKIAGARLS